MIRRGTGPRRSEGAHAKPPRAWRSMSAAGARLQGTQPCGAPRPPREPSFERRGWITLGVPSPSCGPQHPTHGDLPVRDALFAELPCCPQPSRRDGRQLTSSASHAHTHGNHCKNDQATTSARLQYRGSESLQKVDAVLQQTDSIPLRSAPIYGCVVGACRPFQAGIHRHRRRSGNQAARFQRPARMAARRRGKSA